MKKLLALTVAFAMMLSMACPVLAAEEEGSSAGQGGVSASAYENKEDTPVVDVTPIPDPEETAGEGDPNAQGGSTGDNTGDQSGAGSQGGETPSVPEDDVVARVNGVGYTSLQEAIEAVPSGGTVKLVADVVSEGYDSHQKGIDEQPLMIIEVPAKSFTLDGQGRTIDHTSLKFTSGNAANQQMTIKNTVFDNSILWFEVYSSLTGISQMESLTVSDNTFRNIPDLRDGQNDYAITINNFSEKEGLGGTLIVENNRFIGNGNATKHGGFIGAVKDKAVIRNNSFTDMGGMAIAIYGGQYNGTYFDPDIAITGNTIDGWNGYGGEFAAIQIDHLKNAHVVINENAFLDGTESGSAYTIKLLSEEGSNTINANENTWSKPAKAEEFAATPVKDKTKLTLDNFYTDSDATAAEHADARLNGSKTDLYYFRLPKAARDAQANDTITLVRTLETPIALTEPAKFTADDVTVVGAGRTVNGTGLNDGNTDNDDAKVFDASAVTGLTMSDMTIEGGGWGVELSDGTLTNIEFKETERYSVWLTPTDKASPQVYVKDCKFIDTANRDGYPRIGSEYVAERDVLLKVEGCEFKCARAVVVKMKHAILTNNQITSPSGITVGSTVTDVEFYGNIFYANSRLKIFPVKGLALLRENRFLNDSTLKLTTDTYDRKVDASRNYWQKLEADYRDNGRRTVTDDAHKAVLIGREDDYRTVLDMRSMYIENNPERPGERYLACTFVTQDHAFDGKDWNDTVHWDVCGHRGEENEDWRCDEYRFPEEHKMASEWILRREATPEQDGEEYLPCTVEGCGYELVRPIKADPDAPPTPKPTESSAPSVSPEPSPRPTSRPDPDPEPAPRPTARPTPAPSAEPSPEPEVTPAPTAEPAPEPSPTAGPEGEPDENMSDEPVPLWALSDDVVNLWDKDIALSEAPKLEEDDEEEYDDLEDEDTPLARADVPETGDSLFALLSAAISSGLGALWAGRKKRKKDD